MAETTANLPFDPKQLPRELKPHYISASDADIQNMLGTLGLNRLEDLFAHLPKDVMFPAPPDLPEEMPYDAVRERMVHLADKNKVRLSFIGDGLPDFSVHEIVSFVSGIRNLSTAYTPYQPERGQGTLISHWIYQCLMAQLTGFDAVNCSLYDRATAIYEAIRAALRIRRGADAVLVPRALYPGDMEVLETLAAETPVEIVRTPLDEETGEIDRFVLAEQAGKLGKRLAAVVFPQVNHLGLLEDVDALADLPAGFGTLSIAVVDPLLLASGGLKPPAAFGKKGADIITGEAQHLASPPNFGGPGLGLFAIRYHEKTKNRLRVTPGRFAGKARDLSGRDCRVMVLSTREQHIRKEKATSNICSNQAFMATLAGAALLARGEPGLAEMVRKARENAVRAAARLTSRRGVALAFPAAAFFNEIVLRLPIPAVEFIEIGRQAGLHAGVDVSERLAQKKGNLLKLSFSDKHEGMDLEVLDNLFSTVFGPPVPENRVTVPEIPAGLLREKAAGLPQFPLEEVKDYYRKLGELNISPDDACYPLGSCTMKYNPRLNDWAAELPGFANIHPQAPPEDAQGWLEVIYEIQEWFKGITGLAAVATQPVAGAQGELTGLKLIQAYHRSRGEPERNTILIPKSAHGTNFATAAMAGFSAGGGEILLLEAGPDGRVDRQDLGRNIKRAGSRLAGIMITNPNTSGIFETEFKAIADAVHEAGGLVFMDGANMNAIAGWVNLDALGVDAVHNNLHKTWSISHGGGGPGDAIVAVNEKLADFLPGYQIVKENDFYKVAKPPRSAGSFHRHWGNAAHKIRCLAYLLRLGREGVRRMAAVSVLSSRYVFEKLRAAYPALPEGAEAAPRMHEFIITLDDDDFARLEAAGISKAEAVPRAGKLFLDFGFHAPTVAWPEPFGMMIEPAESYTKAELDRFAEAVLAIRRLIREHPETLLAAPHFTPVERIDEVAANRNPCISEPLDQLPPLHPNRLPPDQLTQMQTGDIFQMIIGKAMPQKSSSGLT